MTENLPILYHYPDDELSTNRYICYLEQFDKWFMHIRDIELCANEPQYAGSTLVSMPRETVQVEIYLNQHKMSNEQLMLAIDKGFCYNKRYQLSSIPVPEWLIGLVEGIDPDSLFYLLEHLAEPSRVKRFQAKSDAEILKQFDSFVGSFNN